jgi:glycosyltransferase 2 family protein
LKLIKSRRFWGLLLTVGLLVYCFYDFDFHSVWQAIAAVHFWYLLPLIFLEAIIAYIRTARLKYIIDPVKSIKVIDLYPIYCIGMMTNLLMPYLTGQVARIYLLSKRGQLKKTFLLTTTVLEVLFDGLALIGITLIISIFFVLPSEFRAWHLFVLAGILVLATSFLFWLSRRRSESAGVLGDLIGKLPPKLGQKINEVRSSFLAGLETLRSSKHLLVVLLLSILSWVAQATMVYILILAFGFKISIWGAVIITTVVTIMMIIVLSPVNIGTFQAATRAALLPFGIIKSEALAFSFLLHIAVYIPPIILGAFFSFKEGLTLKQLRDEGEKSVDNDNNNGSNNSLDSAADQILESS